MLCFMHRPHQNCSVTRFYSVIEPCQIFFEPCLAFGAREYNCYFVLSSTELCLLVYCCLLWIMVPSSWPAVTPLCFMNACQQDMSPTSSYIFPFPSKGCSFCLVHGSMDQFSRAPLYTLSFWKKAFRTKM